MYFNPAPLISCHCHNTSVFTKTYACLESINTDYGTPFFILFFLDSWLNTKLGSAQPVPLPFLNPNWLFRLSILFSLGLKILRDSGILFSKYFRKICTCFFLNLVQCAVCLKHEFFVHMTLLSIHWNSWNPSYIHVHQPSNTCTPSRTQLLRRHSQDIYNGEIFHRLHTV